MIKIIHNPPLMFLKHKESGLKLDTRNADYISYEEDKFNVEIIQEKLI